MVQLTTEGAELVVEQLDDVEVIEHVYGPRQVVAHRPDVGRRHVRGHRFDLGPRPPQPPPERLEGIDTLAVADKHHRSGEQVQHHRQVAMALADGDLVDGDLLELVQLGLAETLLQGAGLDVLDHVPAHLEMLGHVLDGHVLRQLQDVPFEGAAVVLLGVGKTQLDLPCQAAVETVDPRHLEVQQDRLATDRHGPERALHPALRQTAAEWQCEQRNRSRGCSM